MADDKITQLLDRLDEAKRVFGPKADRATTRILTQLTRLEFKDAAALIRFHEVLLFLRAYPQSAAVVKLTDRILAAFAARVSALADEGELAYPEVSGIAGTSVIDTFSYYVVRWLVQRFPARVDFYWDWFEDENRLAATWPRFLPLLDEDAAVEANVPYRQWLREAAGQNELHWLIERFESLPLNERARAELYDSQKLYVRWTPAYRATRTGLRLNAGKIFYHRQPLIRRKDVSLAVELEKPAAQMQRLARAEGEKVLDLTREASTVRYRELYGFTHGDPARIVKTSIGRGFDLFIVGLPPEKRLPLRAYHAAMIFKNGVPVGYFEGLSFFERIESGFNFYYTFREGETAWIYARTLCVFKQLLGVTAFSIDPYQVGFENEEGIESGAFWFYRKLGFRPTKDELLKLTLREEKKLSTRQGYRTTPRILRQLALVYMIYELSAKKSGSWDDFQVRKIGLAVQRRMARDFGGDPEAIKTRSVLEVTEALDLQVEKWKAAEIRALSELVPALALIPDLNSWSKSDKALLAKIILSRASPDEAKYLRLMQKHERLREEFIKLGS
jgi:hypothetical protein